MEKLDELDLTPRTRRVLEAATRDAKLRGHRYLGTEHLLLGILTEPDAIVCQVLSDLGVLEKARERVLAIMESAAYSRPQERYGRFPIEFEGELRMPWLDPGVTDDERSALGLPSIAELRTYISEVNRQRAGVLGLTQGLPPDVEVRRVWRPWTRSELLERREREGAACWREGEELVFVHEDGADHVRLTRGLQCEMWRLEGDLWVVGYRVRRLDEAFVSYTFVANDDFAAAFSSGRIATWRGPAAPELAESVGELRGELRHYQVPSRYLPAPRAVHVYLSPGWRESSSTLVVQAADGVHRAHVIEPLVLQGKLPPVVCVGVECLSGKGRADEYLRGGNKARFDAHMAFQTDELPDWTADELGLSPSRERRIVTGQSNGGAFAIWAGLERPDVFGHVLAFSVAGGPPPANLRQLEVSPISVQLVAGTLEPFRGTTTAWRNALDRSGIPVRHQELVAGHDPVLWDIAFLRGLQQLRTG